jgi:hypothetical protein
LETVGWFKNILRIFQSFLGCYPNFNHKTAPGILATPEVQKSKEAARSGQLPPSQKTYK